MPSDEAFVSVFKKALVLQDKRDDFADDDFDGPPPPPLAAASKAVPSSDVVAQAEVESDDELMRGADESEKCVVHHPLLHSQIHLLVLLLSMEFPVNCLGRSQGKWWAASVLSYLRAEAGEGTFCLRWTDGTWGHVKRTHMLFPSDSKFFTVPVRFTSLFLPYAVC